MPQWDYTIKIKDLMLDCSIEDSDEHAAKIAPIVAKRIEMLAKKLANTRLFLSADLEDIADDMRVAKTTEEFDEALRALYDLGDDNRIWVA